ncbi:MAG: aromatic ring-hydroxylating dioxygenase subunit alpha [Gammaproteobacteria bacterium]|nr:aromatic ring-hydroxylating dioxygenase subunit alpha [Gammaproteobacteria bacterium]
MVNVDSLIDLENGVQSKKVFWDQDVYDQEIDRIFGRSWLFLTHESQIPEPGDFFTTFMGEDPIIVARQMDGTIKAFINSCTHRGNQICHADSGNTRSFNCSYHGWSFGIDGELAGVPLEAEVYFNKLDKAAHRLPEVTQVDNYRGFIFGCFDAEAPPLQEWLGEMAWYMDSWADTGGGAELIGTPMKTILKCNWKVPSENFIGDGYHVGWTHSAALQMIGGPLSALSGNGELPPLDDVGAQVTTRHGHGFGVIWDLGHAIHRDPGDYIQFQQQTLPEVIEKKGEWRGKFYTGHWNSGLFPNCSFLYGTNTFKVWHPKGPHEIEVWTWTLVQKNMSPELKREIKKQAIQTFGTAGTLESDDGENMETCTRTNRGLQTRRGSMNASMGIDGDGRHPELPGVLGASFIGETSYRGFYRFWGEIMSAESWSDIRSNDETWVDNWLGKDAVSGMAARNIV